MEKDYIQITINGKTWKGKPAELSGAYEDWILKTFPWMKRRETAYDHDKLLNFLQSYGE